MEIKRERGGEHRRKERILKTEHHDSMPKLLGEWRKYASERHNPYPSLDAVPLGKTGGAKVEEPAIHYF